jgi:choline-sulfatase
MILLLLACEPDPAPRPDVVLVTWDTVRADHVGAATPWLSARSDQAAVFTQARTVAPLTLPAHASLLTGDYPHQHGARANAGFPFQGRTLAHELGEAGYATGAFVSSAVLSSGQGLAAGFSHYDDEVGEGRSRYFGERPGAETVQRALDWVGDQPADQPVFVWVHLFDAHAPLNLEPEQVRPWGDGYTAEVNQVDQASAALWQGLSSRRPGVWVVTADHGEALGEHGEFTHGFYAYDATMRVPLWIWSEGDDRVAPGRHADPVSLVDVAPTLRGLLGLAPHGDGLDLQGRMRGQALPAREILLESVDPALSYGTRPVFGSVQGQRVQLDHTVFSVDSDPGQLAGQGEHESVAPRAWPPASAGQADAATLAQLQALGYVGGLSDGSQHAPSRAAPLMQLEQSGSAGLTPLEALAVVDRVEAELGVSPASLGLRLELLEALGRSEEALVLALEHPDRAATASRLEAELARARALEPAIRSALEAAPEGAVAHADLGGVLWTLGRMDEARAALERAVALGDGPARAQLVTLLVSQGALAEALELADAGDDSLDARCQAGRVALLLDQARPAMLADCQLIGVALGARGQQVVSERAAPVP